MSVRLVSTPVYSCRGCAFLDGSACCCRSYAFIPETVRTRSCTKSDNGGKTLIYASDVPGLPQKFTALEQIGTTYARLQMHVINFKHTLTKEVR